mmetsp:Transcript_93540/g.273921  ORF Transcript_93540/g.273921 Transcript_93540/m.273921 type:complete len:223 (+) Transcript_93540:236-904(+)
MAWLLRAPRARQREAGLGISVVPHELRGPPVPRRLREGRRRGAGAVGHERVGASRQQAGGALDQGLLKGMSLKTTGHLLEPTCGGSDPGVVLCLLPAVTDELGSGGHPAEKCERGLAMDIGHVHVCLALQEQPEDLPPAAFSHSAAEGRLHGVVEEGLPGSLRVRHQGRAHLLNTAMCKCLHEGWFDSLPWSARRAVKARAAQGRWRVKPVGTPSARAANCR